MAERSKRIELYSAEKYVESGNKYAKELQLYALFSLSTMARVNAVSSIRWDQINYAERTCNDVLEKEGKIVTLYFSEEVKELLYILQMERKVAGVNDGGYVFGRDGKQISTQVLADWAHDRCAHITPA